VGTLLAKVTDGSGLHRFAIAIAQDLCFWANSAPCSESDTEFRRVVGAFENSSPMPYNFSALVKEFFASPLVTGAVATGTYPTAGSVPISIARRDHFCAALSNRLGKPDLCAQTVPLPTSTQTATATIAQSVAADAFSRGSQIPVTPGGSDAVLPVGERASLLEHRGAGGRPDLRHRRLLDERRARRDRQHGRDADGLPARPPAHAEAIQIPAGTLRRRADDDVRHRRAGTTTSATNALRSTFILACESPTAVGIGL
jgi:hypothetical protein